MRIPSTLLSLADQGIIDEVVRPLMSGKEAEVFLVRAGGKLRVSKVYKEAQNRTFKNRAGYTEGRSVRNSRDQRAMNKRSRYGREQDEAAWRSTEVDMIYRLRDAGVRVPTPHHFIDGVLIMELITDANGDPAPRLAEVHLSPEEAVQVFNRLLAEAVRMLCAGVVHGDLSDFNVLMGAEGPVIIDFPQAVDASSNQNARKLLQRDVDNLQRFLSRFAPNHQPRPYAQEMWDLYARSELTPDTRLSGRFRSSSKRADTAAVLDLINEADHDERRRREARGQNMRGVPPAPRRVEVLVAPRGLQDRARRGPPGAHPQGAQAHAGGAASPRPDQRGGGSSPRPPHESVAGRPRSPQESSAGRPRPPQESNAGRPRPPQESSASRPRPHHESAARPRPHHESAGRPRPPQESNAGRPRPPQEGAAPTSRETPAGSGGDPSNNAHRRRIVRSGRTTK